MAGVLISAGEALEPLIARYGLTNAASLIGKGILGGVGMGAGSWYIKGKLKKSPKRKTKRRTKKSRKSRIRRHKR